MLSSQRKRRPYAPRVPAEQRREQLLDAALRVVVTQGHSAATMDAVAEQAGVTKPVVYSQFRSRNELLTALLRREQRGAFQQVEKILPTRLTRDQVAGMLNDFLEAVQQAPDRWHCIVMPVADMPTEFHDARARAHALALRQVEQLLEADLDTEIIAHAVVALFETAARLVLTDPERYQPGRFVTAIRAAIGLR
ncbi:TetR/AcrR family transcriptional regulator [Kibdelosporangium philippinense]|uniref:TetR/AcrR family transcriptional regulator n=1 Tax=Kibdelosporangium philippinense TaxID=211113 RepID=A0ABS8ZT03_9PSEU|nr:TetR/AcrR family transcriptional regulator [Kibdelosporangium philippinense]MCE7009746.1 TetR/AcrR family transcriptional regulator [Kibdelosporangium philippinense]